MEGAQRKPQAEQQQYSEGAQRKPNEDSEESVPPCEPCQTCQTWERRFNRSQRMMSRCQLEYESAERDRVTAEEAVSAWKQKHSDLVRQLNDIKGRYRTLQLTESARTSTTREERWTQTPLCITDDQSCQTDAGRHDQSTETEVDCVDKQPATPSKGPRLSPWWPFDSMRERDAFLRRMMACVGQLHPMAGRVGIIRFHVQSDWNRPNDVPSRLRSSIDELGKDGVTALLSAFLHGSAR